MRIKIWTAQNPRFPTVGPYRLLDTIQRDTLYLVDDVTLFGDIIATPPPMYPFTEDADQSVIVRLHPDSSNESVLSKGPFIHNKLKFAPLHVNPLDGEASPSGTSTLLAAEHLTVEDVSMLITPDTFSVWKHDCNISRDTAAALQKTTYAIVHRYSTEARSNARLDQRSPEILDLAIACLALIRPTRRTRAAKIDGEIRPDGTLAPWSFNTREPVEVPEIQKLFKIRDKDVELLRTVLPEFLLLYQKGDSGRFVDDYEPLRMAVQLYEQAYAIEYWKARHILWWAAIESIFGNDKDTATARIYALFGNKNLLAGYDRSIYDADDIPSCFSLTYSNDHKLGQMLPKICAVRDFSAHGQKVSDLHFASVPHPFGTPVCSLDIMAEAATFIIRKAIVEILRQGFRSKFKDRTTREEFWLLEYGLDGKQSKKRLRELNLALTTRN